MPAAALPSEAVVEVEGYIVMFGEFLESSEKHSLSDFAETRKKTNDRRLVP